MKTTSIVSNNGTKSGNIFVKENIVIHKTEGYIVLVTATCCNPNNVAFSGVCIGRGIAEGYLLANYSVNRYKSDYEQFIGSVTLTVE